MKVAENFRFAFPAMRVYVCMSTFSLNVWAKILTVVSMCLWLFLLLRRLFSEEVEAVYLRLCLNS